MTIAEAKVKVNGNTALKEYMGVKITDYNPTEDINGVYRIFYYDAENDGNGNGYFGPTGKLYLRRDLSCGAVRHNYANYKPSNTATTKAIELMGQMNPMWKESDNSPELDQPNEKIVQYMCDQNEWIKYCDTNVADYAIAGCGIEMFLKSYNIWTEGKDEMKCRIENQWGYHTGRDGSFSELKYPSNAFPNIPIEFSDLNRLFNTGTIYISYSLASPASNAIGYTGPGSLILKYDTRLGCASNVSNLSPLVRLK